VRENLLIFLSVGIVDSEEGKGNHRILGFAQLCEATIIREIVRDEDVPTRGIFT
jgi:hypothetical protein